MRAPATGKSLMNSIPSFNLYLDGDGIVEPRFLHIETIPMRSRENDWTIRPHRHPELFQFLLLTAGAAEMQLEGSTARLVAPALTAVTPNAIHGYVFRPDTEGYVLTIAEAYLSELVGHAGDAAARNAIRTSAIVPLAEDLGTVEEIRLACERVFLESRREQAGKHALVAADLLRILGLFIRLTESARGSRNDATLPDNLFERFRTLVEECFRDQLTITDYAERLATSERTLRRATQARSGRTPLEILKQRTLLEAQRDLLYTARSVAEVAYGLGFEDQAYFSRFFATGTGLTPTQFRKQHKSYLTGTPEIDTTDV
tara:strand:+ start:1136 stop:2083 length:948 start_codon:yes stop_codon:yes gene_type:complete